MSIRLVLALFVLAAPAGAAPLCHDLRGLYTPCVPGQGAPPRRHVGRKTAPRPADKPAVHADAAAVSPDTTVAPAAVVPAPPAPAAAKKPGLFARGTKVCRDLKGLATPCPR